MKKILNWNFFTYLFFIIYFIIGLSIYKDFGVGIEEHFQRQNGFYWLNHFFSNSNFENLKSIIDLKYKEILELNADLPPADYYNYYGVVFDLPLAFIETIFNLSSSKVYFEIRHIFIFTIFFISSIYFYKILANRFNNNLVIFLGLFLYISSPRIFGDSFHNNKDILFLSILTISISYLFDLFKTYNIRNLLLFCFFCSLATASRIMGIYLPFILILFYFFDFLLQKISFKKLILITSKIIIIFYLFLLLNYPYAWQLDILNITNWFGKFFYSMDIEVLFNGEYYMIDYLPRSYLPIWILISTPIIISVFFLIGFSKISSTIYKRLINIDEKKVNKKGDLWNSIHEKKDLLVYVSFFIFLVYAIFFNVSMLSGWRHFYFLHIFIIYISVVGMSNIFKYLKSLSQRTNYIFASLIIMSSLHTNFKLHPFQSLYFISILNADVVQKFQVDTPNLSRSHALKWILQHEKNKTKKIYVSNASWTPMHNGKDMLNNVDQKRLVFVGQEYNQADYIYTNYVNKSDEKYNKNYKIPSNFKKIQDFKKGNILIYSIYSKSN